jgi:hypothetical protein
VAEVVQAERSLLTSKWGPLPVWGWALIGLGLAWAYAKYRSTKTADTGDSSADDAATSESEDVIPQFVIENNMPTPSVTVIPPGVGAPTTPSAPITTLPAPSGPVITPPGTAPRPPVAGHPAPPASPKKPIHYKVVAGDTPASIAKKHGTTWAKIWAFNMSPSNRAKTAIDKLKKIGNRKVQPGEILFIPQ